MQEVVEPPNEQRPFLDRMQHDRIRGRLKFLSTCHGGCCPKSNAVLLILTWSVIIAALHPTSVISVTSGVLVQHSNQIILTSSLYGGVALVWLFYPLAGLLADVCFGRYKVVVCSLRTMCITVFVGGTICGLTCLLIISADNNAVHISWAALIGVFGGTSYLVILFSFVLFHANVFQFGIDQLQDAPSKELKLYVYWCTWTYFIGFSVTRLLYDTFACYLNLFLVILFLVSAVGFIVLPVSLCFIHCRRVRRWFVIEPGQQNPYKLVYKVLKFAATHNRPIQRSAFTYCEDELPSRLDLGKSKYGGPFTTEEVENVKVFVEILFVLIALGPFFVIELANYVSIPVFNFHLVGDWTNGSNGSCDNFVGNLFFGDGLLTLVIAVVSIPLYILLVSMFPRILKYTPGILKRIGLAMLMYLIALLSTFFTDVIGHTVTNPNATCMFTTDQYDNQTRTDVQTQTLHMTSSVLLTHNIFCGLGLTLFYTAAFEFVCAQSPHQMKGMIIGTFFAIKGVSQLLAVVFLIPFNLWSEYNALFPSCGFAYYLINIFIAVVGLLIYTLVARRYHYRQRDEPTESNIQQYVENYYERTVSQSEPAI